MSLRKGQASGVPMEMDVGAMDSLRDHRLKMALRKQQFLKLVLQRRPAHLCGQVRCILRFSQCRY